MVEDTNKSNRGNVFHEMPTKVFFEMYEEELIEKIKSLDHLTTKNIAEQAKLLENIYTLDALRIERISYERKKEASGSDNFIYPGKSKEVKPVVLEVYLDFNVEKAPVLLRCYPADAKPIFLHPDTRVRQTDIQTIIEIERIETALRLQAEHKIKVQLAPTIELINAEIAIWNKNVPSLIAEELEKQRISLLNDAIFWEEIPLKEIADVNLILEKISLKRREISQPVAETSTKIPRERIKEINQAFYEGVLLDIYNAGRTMEDKTSLYEEKGEDALSDLFVQSIQHNYTNATCTRETQNHGGRADILIQLAEDKSKLFIAECKVWHGEKKLGLAIDQLLRYTNHRVSKTALMIFVKETGFEDIKKKANEAMQAHPNCKNL